MYRQIYGRRANNCGDHELTCILATSFLAWLDDHLKVKISRIEMFAQATIYWPGEPRLALGDLWGVFIETRPSEIMMTMRLMQWKFDTHRNCFINAA